MGCEDRCEHLLSNGENCGAEGFATFGSRNRRHHCRACGITTCAKHSSHCLLLGDSTTPERVCDRCWKEDRQWSLHQSNEASVADAEGQTVVDGAMTSSQLHVTQRVAP